MLFETLTHVEERYNTLNELMAQPDIATDPSLLQQYVREQRELESVVGAMRTYRQVLHAIDETQTLLDDGVDHELRALAEEELLSLREQRATLETQIKLLLLPQDSNDTRNVICEIRQGEGGDEAALFAADLYRMYARYAESRRWSVDIISAMENGIGGMKEVVFRIQGNGCYSRMKYEGGVHRVQRVPETEARGRIHTSTATVAVLPEIEPTEIEIRDDDYRIDVFRSQGHGGQGVNTTNSAVRIVYRPGTPEEIVVTCQDSRSQLKNKAQALSVLRAKLYAQEQQKHHHAVGASRLAQVGTGERAEKIRTYNFPQDRITDHRIGQNFSNLPAILAGDLDRIIDALILYDNAERLKAAGLSDETTNHN